MIIKNQKQNGYHKQANNLVAINFWQRLKQLS